MKPWHIAMRSRRRERFDRFAPGILTVAFVLGFFADRLHLTYWLRWGLYAGLIGAGIYVTATLLQIIREPVKHRSLRVSDSELEYQSFGSERLVISWDRIESVVFCREEALFESYLETSGSSEPATARRLTRSWMNGETAARCSERYASSYPGLTAVRPCRTFDHGARAKWVCLQR